MNKGPTIVIVRDRDGHVFGGFAPSSWTLSPNYVGDDSSFLFSILPVMERFEPTGYNDHYQYLNVQQQTLPNGLFSSERKTTRFSTTNLEGTENEVAEVPVGVAQSVGELKLGLQINLLSET
ncbi:MTOR-associated protein MEAK7-like [Schistocerca piceifrons]|uniref:MTOR-associated protein MEAK7-like n=1 Tax=Schistocerca piceifrons TaxID=274613 RepID=UPI001F5E55B5|nr:MTOR-associated protein MEAK7-like [Schistocerca piceifrons]